jgi:hypothetical protein
MHDDLIRWHITRVARGDELAEDRLATGVSRCWPAGLADRSDPAALEWLRRWRPARSLSALPACSCAAGRCMVCN